MEIDNIHKQESNESLSNQAHSINNEQTHKHHTTLISTKRNNLTSKIPNNSNSMKKLNSVKLTRDQEQLLSNFSKLSENYDEDNKSNRSDSKKKQFIPINLNNVNELSELIKDLSHNNVSNQSQSVHPIQGK